MRMSSRTMWALVALGFGAGLAAMYLPAARGHRSFHRHQDDDRRVDEASEDSFPASDPPSFSGPAGGSQVGGAAPM